MMKATQVTSGAASSGYYKAEGYYTKDSPEADEASRWFGRATETLGLEGPVDGALFTRMLDGQTFVRDGEDLAPDRLMGRFQDGKRQHRPGLDLTFSAPKSVSVAALVYGDERLIEAHDKAVQTAMTHVQDHLVQTRFYVNGQLRMQTGGDIVAGLFRHDTSRALDPQLHTHAVIANQVHHPDGSVTALHNDLIFQSQKLGSEIYRTELSRAARALGYEVAREGQDMLVVLRDVPSEVVSHFSKRRLEIEKALEDRNLPDTPRNAELAALATRATKNKGVDRDELRAVWETEARDLGLSRADMDATLAALRTKSRFHVPGQTRGDADAPIPPDASASLDQAIGHLSERRVHYSEVDLISTSLSYARGSGLDDIQRAYTAALKSGDLRLVKVPGETRTMLTDARTLIMEREIAIEYRQASKTKAIDLPERHTLKGLLKRSADGLLSDRLNRTSLTDGQKEAVQIALSARGRFVGVQGYAGTGKTYMLEQLQKQAQHSGYEVMGLAPSNQAVTELQSALPSAETLQAHLMRRGSNKGPDPSRTILVIDEASMVSNEQMRDIMRLSNQRGIARVVLVGDVQQLDAVSAGTPFAALQRAGMPTAVMDDIQRQRNETALSIVKHAIAGEVREAFEKIGDRISAHEDPSRVAAETYLSLSPQERGKTGLLTPTNAARVDINLHVRDGLRAEGRLSGPDQALPNLIPLNLTRAEKSDVRSWRVGDVAIAFQPFKSVGLQSGHLYDVTDKDEMANSVVLTDRQTGERHLMPLRQSGKSTTAVQLYEPARTDFAIGDQVKFRITDRGSEIRNGETGRITGFTTEAILLQDSKGQHREIDRRSLAAVGMDHGYALTGHDFQGATVDRIIVTMTANEQLATQKSFYVAVSRARDEVILKTDYVEDLADRLTRQTGQTIPALEAWLAARLDREIAAEKVARETPEKTSEQPPKTERDAASKERQEDARKDPEPEPANRSDEALGTDHATPSREPEKTAEAERQTTMDLTPPARSSKAQRLAALGTPEQQEMFRELLDRIQQKQRGDFER